MDSPQRSVVRMRGAFLLVIAMLAVAPTARAQTGDEIGGEGQSPASSTTCSVKSCEEMKLTLKGSADSHVCGFSKWANGGKPECFSGEGNANAGNYDDANAWCKSFGARLCTAKEITQGVVQDDESTTGCDLDDANIWSQTACTDAETCAVPECPGHSTVLGGAGGGESTCVEDSKAASVRCCVDDKTCDRDPVCKQTGCTVKMPDGMPCEHCCNDFVDKSSTTCEECKANRCTSAPSEAPTVSPTGTPTEAPTNKCNSDPTGDPEGCTGMCDAAKVPCCSKERENSGTSCDACVFKRCSAAPTPTPSEAPTASPSQAPIPSYAPTYADDVPLNEDAVTIADALRSGLLHEK